MQILIHTVVKVDSTCLVISSIPGSIGEDLSGVEANNLHVLSCNVEGDLLEEECGGILCETVRRKESDRPVKLVDHCTRDVDKMFLINVNLARCY